MRTRSVRSERARVRRKYESWRHERVSDFEKAQWAYCHGRVCHAYCAWLDGAGRWIPLSQRYATYLLETHSDEVDDASQAWPLYLLTIAQMANRGTVPS